MLDVSTIAVYVCKGLVEGLVFHCKGPTYSIYILDYDS